MQSLTAQRKAHGVFGTQGLTVADSGHPSVLVFHKQIPGQILTVIGNFSESPVILPQERIAHLLAGQNGKDLLSGRLVLVGEALELQSCELLWILNHE
jgi:hypothetical protein